MPNHLIHETSPYLQQHAENPVDWYPWCDEALDRARKENKPILLSIGYAACHWCHVMAHETFEDKATADVMNKYFINIKVDREERPDLDKIYQMTHYLLMRRSGGWPLTVFLTPIDYVPFFSGTYFPAEAKHGLPAFKDLLQEIHDVYTQKYQDIQLQNAELLKALNSPQPMISDLRLNDQPITHALQEFKRHYDHANGGFGGAPKFPQPVKLEFLLHHDSPMATDTLLRIANGGINDQLSGGFFRYSVDAQWRIPHFEKMLYDNGQLLNLYALAYQKTQHQYFAEIARQTANWVITTMQSPEGGYYSSLDADSEGHEGKFYVWDKEEIKNLLSPEEFTLIEKHFALDQSPNFEGAWHLFIADTSTPSILSIREKLLSARAKRIPPSIDNKVLISWNALMIKGMMTAGYILNEPAFIRSAENALLCIENDFNKTKLKFLDDYAFLIDALLSVYQFTSQEETLNFAVALTDTMLDEFYDSESGGFYFTSKDHEKLLYRPKGFMDEAIPSGNGVAAHCLLTLGKLLNQPRYLEAAKRTLQSSWPLLTQYPAEHCELLLALQEHLEC